MRVSVKIGELGEFFEVSRTWNNKDQMTDVAYKDANGSIFATQAWGSGDDEVRQAILDDVVNAN